MKKWAKILAFLGVMVIGLSAGLAGCATVSSIANSSDEIIYNGNVAVNVDGYVYFGNSIVSIDDITSSTTYNSSAKLSYLARVDTNDVTATSKDYSPSSVDSVSTEVTAYDNSFMFVLGNYIYYATPFTQEIKSDGEVAHYYEYTTIYRSKLNGDKKTKLYSTSSSVSQIEVLKDPDSGKYYIVIYEGDKLVSINLSTSKAKTLAEDVTSVAMPETYNSGECSSSLDFNGLIYYTAEPENDLGNTNSGVYAVTLSGDVTSYKSGTNDISFIDRVNDVLIYSQTSNSQTNIYMLDVSAGGFSVATESAKLFTTSSTLSDFRLIYDKDAGNELGYIFLWDSTLAYVTVEKLSNTESDGSSTSSKFYKAVNYSTLSISADGSSLSDYEIISLDGRTLYLATTTGIYSVILSYTYPTADGKGNDISIYSVSTIVTMTAIYDGDYFAYDGTYIYYYAQLEELATDTDEDEDSEDEDSDEEDTDETADEYYYLYRVQANGNGSYQLLGYTSDSSRHTTD